MRNPTIDLSALRRDLATVALVAHIRCDHPAVEGGVLKAQPIAQVGKNPGR